MSVPWSKDDKLLLWFVIGSVVLMNVPYGEYALYPFKLFATWIHETFHGLAALVTGGSVEWIRVHADTSGLTLSATSSGAARALVSSMGYMGTALVGAGLLALRNRPKAQRIALGVIGVGALLTLIFWVRNAFGAVAVGLIAAAIAVLTLRATDRWASIATNVLASQACINALLDIRVLYSVGGDRPSDAASMANITGTWYWLWATIWLLASVGLFWLAWSKTRRSETPAKPVIHT